MIDDIRYTEIKNIRWKPKQQTAENKRKKEQNRLWKMFTVRNIIIKKPHSFMWVASHLIQCEGDVHLRNEKNIINVRHIEWFESLNNKFTMWTIMSVILSLNSLPFPYPKAHVGAAKSIYFPSKHFEEIIILNTFMIFFYHFPLRVDCVVCIWGSFFRCLKQWNRLLNSTFIILLTKHSNAP